MKVLFLTLYPEIAASPRYRVHQFIPHLESVGIQCTIAPAVTPQVLQNYSGPNATGRPFWYHWHETRTRKKQLRQLERYDCIFLQKAIMTAYLKGMERNLEPIAHKLVYDLDDAVHLAPPHPLGKRWSRLEDKEQVEKVLGLASLTLAGNAWLMEKVSAWCDNVKRFPTVVDTTRFVPADTTPDAYRLGWIGSPSTVNNLSPVIGMLPEWEDVQLSIIGATRDTPHPQVSCQEWALEEEVNAIQSFSVGLMPLTPSSWNRGKCALKALQYMACGIPCIATNFGAVQDIITHEKDGLLVNSSAEWRDAIEALRDSAYRKALGDAARETVERKYALHQAAPRLATLLRAYG